MSEALKRFGYGGVAFIFGSVAVWVLLLIVVPHALMIDYSFRYALPPSELGGVNDVYTFDNFVAVRDDASIRDLLLRTVFASVLVTVMSLVVCYPIAYYLAKVARGSLLNLLMLGLLVPFWINEVLRVYAWQILLARGGPINGVLDALGIIDKPIAWLNVDAAWSINWVLLTLGLIDQPLNFLYVGSGLLIGMTYAYILFMIFPLYNAMESLDRNQIEAARDLGASWARIHWRIVIPHAKPGLASGCIVTFMLAAGSFIVPVLLAGTKGLWFTQLIETQFSVSDWNAGSAYALTLEVLCLIFILIMMRVFRVGIRDIAK